MATSRTGFSENRIWNVTRYYWNYYRNYQFISSQITGWPIRPLSTAIAVVFVGIQFRFRETHFWTGILTSLTALSVDFAYRFFTVSRIYFFNPRIKGPPESPSTYALDALPGNNLAQSVGGVDSHKHTPLPHNDSFRLLLLKGGTKDILECEIIEMSTDTIADYEALSYTWGSPTPQKYILCNGKRLPITENCEAALRHLRLPLAGRLLWVDSICIDQSSIIEKNQQVRLMGHIYSRAKDVMIWLGPGTPESDIAPQYIHLYARLIDLPQTLREYFEERVKLKILQRGHQKIIWDIVARPWFTRVWTLQEMALARPGHSLAICGAAKTIYDSTQLPLYDVSVWLTFVSDYPFNAIHMGSLVLRTSLRGDIAFPSEHGEKAVTASRMMGYMLACDTTDPKDRVYSLYAILQKQGIVIPEPDYNKSLGQIYWETTATIIKHEESLDVLLLISGIGPGLPDVPSWVPDFREAYTLRNAHGYGFSATFDSSAQFVILDDDKILHTSASVIDVILDCSANTTWQPGPSTTRVEDSLLMNLELGCQQTIKALRDWTWLPFKTGYKSRYDESNRLVAFRETLLYGFISESHMHTRQIFMPWVELIMCTNPNWCNTVNGEEVTDNAKLNALLQRARENPELRAHFFENPDSHELMETDEWKILCAAKTLPGFSDVHHHVWMMSRDCTFFVTKSGYVGTGPYSIQEGGVIALIPGLQMPMVLRPAEEVGHYRVVAPAYVQGMMQGEIWGEWKEKVEAVMLI